MSDPGHPLISRAIPTLRVASAHAAFPTYAALGFHVAWEHQLTTDAPRLVCIRQGDVELFLTEHRVTDFGAVVYFVTRDVDALVVAASEAGVTPTFGPEDRPWGDREAYFQDRDGNTLRFGQTRHV